MSKCISCNNLGPAARLSGYVVEDTGRVGGIGRKAMGDFLSIDMKPFLMLGAAYLAYRYFIKKHG